MSAFASTPWGHVPLRAEGAPAGRGNGRDARLDAPPVAGFTVPPSQDGGPAAPATHEGGATFRVAGAVFEATPVCAALALGPDLALTLRLAAAGEGCGEAELIRRAIVFYAERKVGLPGLLGDLQGGEEESRVAHNHEVARSNRAPATNSVLTADAASPLPRDGARDDARPPVGGWGGAPP